MNLKFSEHKAEKNIFFHKLADLRGGVGIKTEYPFAKEIPAGTPIYRTESGLYAPLASAEVVEKVDNKKYYVKGNHCFLVGSKVSLKSNAVATVDKIEIHEGRGLIEGEKMCLIALKQDGDFIVGDIIFEKSDSEAVAVLGSSVKTNQKENVFVEAFTRADIDKRMVTPHKFAPKGVNYV